MKRYLIAVFCSAFVYAIGILSVAYAEGPAGPVNAAAQKHIDIAKAAAYRPGFDLVALYERVCAPALSEKGPDKTEPAKEAAPGSTQLAAVKVTPRPEWYYPATKVFDNLYWLGSHGDSFRSPDISG